jgi:Phosphoserine phosphatase RsbU, N-terminal domain
MSATLERFGAAYTTAFRAYVADETEADLRSAYELGREAVCSELSMLDLTLVHHNALLDVLRETPASDVERVTRAAAAFVLESVSAFEMVRRGFAEARAATLAERRQATMLRQLSNFLADGSLALVGSESLEEMLQIVAEQALELVGGDSCRVSVVGDDGEIHEAVSASDVDATESIAAQLTALDGRVIGSIDVASGDDWSEIDDAVLQHLAQMVSAAVERAWLYRPR